MKKTIFASLLAIATSAVFAQANINKGDWMLGGNASFSSQKYKGYEGSTTSFELTPDAGYFFIDQLAGGLSFAYASSKSTGEDALSAYAIAPFVRYYFLPATQKVNVFAQGAYLFGSVPVLDESVNTEGYAFSAGPSVFLSPSTALEVSLSYSSLGGDAYLGTRSNTLGIQVGFQIHLAGKK